MTVTCAHTCEMQTYFCIRYRHRCTHMSNACATCAHICMCTYAHALCTVHADVHTPTPLVNHLSVVQGIWAEVAIKKFSV